MANQLNGLIANIANAHVVPAPFSGTELYQIENKYTAYCANNNLADNLNTIIIFGIHHAVSGSLQQIIGRDAADQADITFHDHASADFKANERKWVTALKGLDIFTMAVHLVMTAQVSPISGENVTNYLASMRLEHDGDVIAAFVNRLAPLHQNLIETQEAKTHVNQNKWVKYRVTVASGIGLVKKAMGISPNAFTQADVNAVDAYLASPWEMKHADAVTSRAKAIAHIILDTFDMLPSRWYQGEKALNDFPANKMAALRQAAKMIKSSKAQAYGITDESTLQQVNSAIVEIVKL